MNRKITLVIRLLLGLLFLFSGVMGLFKLVPPPPDLPEALKAFNAGLEASLYFMPLLKSTEIFCGLCLISGFFVPLALVILAPIAINIMCVHYFIAPMGIPVGIAVNLAMFYLSFFSEGYSKVIRSLFRP